MITHFQQPTNSITLNNKSLTWEDIIDEDPRIQVLYERAIAYFQVNGNEDNFIWHDTWYNYLKPDLKECVFHTNKNPRYKSSYVFDLCTRKILDALEGIY